MAFFRNSRENRFWPYLVGCFVMIFMAILGEKYFFQQNRPGNIASQIQSVFLKKEARAIEELNLLVRNFSNQPFQKGVQFSLIGKTHLEKEGLSFFIYEKDSLVYWSSNLIPGIETLRQVTATPRVSILKLSNGWYYFYQKKDLTRTYVVFILIEHCYPFRNEYLHNSYQTDFNIRADIKVTNVTGRNNIYSSTGIPIFSLEIPCQSKISPLFLYILFILYSAGFILFLVFLYKLYSHLLKESDHKALLLLGIIASVFILRLLQFLTRFPRIIYDSDLFGPHYFSSSQILPSLGDFMIDSLLMLFLAYVFFRSYPGIYLPVKKRSSRYVFCILQMLCIVIGFQVSLYLVWDLVFNSTLNLNLQNIAGITLTSIIGFTIIAVVFLSFFLFSFRLSVSTWYLFQKNSSGHQETNTTRISLSWIVFFLVFFSVLSTLILNICNTSSEKEKRKLLALKLGVERDPVVEMLFSRQEEQMDKDSLLFGSLEKWKEGRAKISEDSIAHLIQRRYFREAWNNYAVQVTLCIGKKVLRIQPQNYLYDCNSYFGNLLREFGKSTDSKNLFFLDYGYGYKNYLAVIPLTCYPAANADTVVAFIEISSKLVLKDQGYPGLLVDNPQGQIRAISGYSYAFYRDSKLIQRFGNVDYSLELDHTFQHTRLKAHFYSSYGYNHFFYPINQKDFLIISKQEPTMMDVMAPFSYLFFFFTLLTFLFYAIVRFGVLIRISFSRMAERIQVSMTAIMIVSFLIIGGLIIYYIGQLNTKKDIDNLNERTHSVLVELQHKYGSGETLDEQSSEDLNEQMTRLSNVFFTDVNLYNPQGRLISSSRPEIFEEGLISYMMNRCAFEQLQNAHSSFLVIDEQIGGHYYHSAFMPVYNDRNQLLAYLNLPYFARQEEMKHEISSFLVTFINVYVFLIILGVIISLIVSSYITHPLKLLTTRLGRISFGKTNEKINWRRKDEIGKLIEEYNIMVDELVKSADVLIRSEREGAWREMARQVAHEIKNPLTPMKLSVQYLEKAWNENAPGWESRLKRFSQTMIEQIEALSSIAAEFSNFAQMPATQNEVLDPDEVLQRVMALYDNFPNIGYTYYPASVPKYILADRKQLYRVFTNLINNAIQAIEGKKTGHIQISLVQEYDFFKATVADDGVGISPDQFDRVFLPNFTTKSGGMGLGLAIVRNIVTEAGGRISFVSQKNEGTIFTITFPAAEQPG